MNQTLQQKKLLYMTSRPVESLVCKMAAPSILSMLISAFYNMADTFFIGKISTQATAAIGIVFSYMALIQAMAFFFGHGSGNYISRELGKQNNTNAAQMAATGFFSAFFVGLIFCILGLLFLTPLLRLLGATPTILPEAKSYFIYILLATPFMMCSMVLNNQMRLQGNANKAMIGILTGALLNVFLDPIFIFTFKLGIQGASIATALSQTIGFVILFVLSGKQDGIRIQWKHFSPTLHNLKEIAAGGLPSLCRQGLASIATLSLNHMAGIYGDSAIAAFSVVTRVTGIASSALIGFGQGFQPVCGFNYGAKKYERVKKAFWFCVKISSTGMLMLGALCFAFSEPIIRLFRDDDPELILIGMKTLRLQSIAFPFLGWVIIVNMFLQTTRKTIPATITAMARQGIVFLPVMFLSGSLFGLSGLQAAQPAADVITFLLSIPFGLYGLRELTNIPASSSKN